MTLIFSARYPTFFAVSDLMISSGESGGKPTTLALHREPVGEVGIHQFSGTCQKSIILGKRTIVLWAGIKVVAESIISQIRVASQNGEERVDLASVMAEMSLTNIEIDGVSIIYHHWNGLDLNTQSHSAELVDGPGKMLVAGSGAWDWIENHQLTYRPSDFAGTGGIGHFWGRLFTTLMHEIHDKNPLHYAYGGWFEVAYLTPNGFEKQPYALKVWRKDETGYGLDTPLWFSQYDEETLIVTRVIMAVKNGRLEPQIDLFVNTPFHERNYDLSRIKYNTLAWTPTVVCHAIIRDGTRFTMLIKQLEHSFRVKFGKDEIYFDIDPRLIEEFDQSLSAAIERPLFRKPTY